MLCQGAVRLPKIMIVHNRYQQSGGEDAVVEAESDLLARWGHGVWSYCRDNREIRDYSLFRKIALAKHTVWAWNSYFGVQRVIGQAKPDLVHFHNTLPLISPAAYYACREAGVPVVQTLHNYRLLCAGATFSRDGHACEDCLGKSVPWPGVLHACYRQSRSQTAAVGAMLTFHRWFKTWKEQIDIYIALTEFARKKFIQGGLPKEKILVKPNFVHPDPRARNGVGEYALFVGRLSQEKGVHTLLRAWQCLKKIPLRIVGDGPLLEKVRMFVGEQKLAHVKVLRKRTREEVFLLLKGAQFLVFPSECYENFPVTVVEAFACGVPVIGSRLGAMKEIVENGRTGLHFAPGDPDDLAAKIDWALTHPKSMEEVGREARAEYEAKYTATRNYQMLMDIYHRVLETHRAG